MLSLDLYRGSIPLGTKNLMWEWKKASRQRSYTARSQSNALGCHGFYYNPLSVLYSYFECLVMHITWTDRCLCTLYRWLSSAGSRYSRSYSSGNCEWHHCYRDAVCFLQTGCKPSPDTRQTHELPDSVVCALMTGLWCWCAFHLL